MAMSVEWRVHDGGEAIVVVDVDGPGVAEVATPDAAILTDYLAVTGDLQRWRQWTAWRPVQLGDDLDPEAWGELVVSRTGAGDVVSVNPELYWEGIRRWFRVRGTDVKK
ncbi:MAG: hypothetical protein O3B65_00790 [Chloroflexi bacterium]|nr:hypothetical protein [Chloroflexota bacterium]